MAIFLLRTLRLSTFAFVNSVFGRCGKVPLDRSCWVLRLLAPVSLCIRMWILIKIVFFTDLFVFQFWVLRSTSTTSIHDPWKGSSSDNQSEHDRSSWRPDVQVSKPHWAVDLSFICQVCKWRITNLQSFKKGTWAFLKKPTEVCGSQMDNPFPSLPTLSSCSYNKLVAAQILLLSRTWSIILYRSKECSYGPTKSWQKLIERSPGLTLCNVPFVTVFFHFRAALWFVHSLYIIISEPNLQCVVPSIRYYFWLVQWIKFHTRHDQSEALPRSG